MQTEPSNFSSRTLHLVVSKKKSILGLMALYKALYKTWLGVLEWSTGVRESIVEACIGSLNLKRKNTQIFYYLSIL